MKTVITTTTTTEYKLQFYTICCVLLTDL